MEPSRRGEVAEQSAASLQPCKNIFLSVHIEQDKWPKYERKQLGAISCSIFELK